MTDTLVHQKNQDHLDDLQVEMDDFSRLVYEAHLKRFNHVAKSDNSEKLEGVTLGQLRKEFTDKISEHVEKKLTNVHRIDPNHLNLT